MHTGKFETTQSGTGNYNFPSRLEIVILTMGKESVSAGIVTSPSLGLLGQA